MTNEEIIKQRGERILETASDKFDAETKIRHMVRDVLRHRGGTLISVTWSKEIWMRQASVLPKGYAKSIMF